MSKFGKITKTKIVTKTLEQEVLVKSWRARLAERLLSKDIEDLESLIRADLEETYLHDVKKQAEGLVGKWWRNYQYQLDDELLEAFPGYEPFLKFQDYKGGDTLADVAEEGYKKVRVNGQWVVFIPRFKKAPIPTNSKDKEDK